MRKIYMDNAATSFPKPKSVALKTAEFIKKGVNVNRSSYSLAYFSEELVYDTRKALCGFFGFGKEANVVFTQNITSALNTVLKGYLKPGDHVIASSLEHNSVMRPLRELESTGVELSFISSDCHGNMLTDDVELLFRHNTKALVCTHASNVCGTLQPAELLGRLCKKHNTAFITDTAQTAGVFDIPAENIDVLCFTGHKGLMGPQGIGGFIVKDSIAEQISPLISGGTGSISQLEAMPDFLPDKFEAGTLNLPGIAGLKAGLDYILRCGKENIKSHELKLTELFLSSVNNCEGILIHGRRDIRERTGTVSVSIPGKDSGEVGYALEQKGILTRTGLHCAPAAHKVLGTFPEGTVRFSFGAFNTEKEVLYAAKALKAISEEKQAWN